MRYLYSRSKRSRISKRADYNGSNAHISLNAYESNQSSHKGPTYAPHVNTLIAQHPALAYFET